MYSHSFFGGTGRSGKTSAKAIAILLTIVMVATAGYVTLNFPTAFGDESQTGSTEPTVDLQYLQDSEYHSVADESGNNRLSLPRESDGEIFPIIPNGAYRLTLGVAFGAEDIPESGEVNTPPPMGVFPKL
ncbi:MAG: hypothetical protein LBS85_06370 [Clostridiales Family XIII bacterium]|jgi:hypothetical protein|nr:hypothetical protein [Clostridiales Family XIII bacterium]